MSMIENRPKSEDPETQRLLDEVYRRLNVGPHAPAEAAAPPVAPAAAEPPPRPAPEHGVQSGAAIRRFMDQAADAIERVGVEMVQQATDKLEEAKERQTILNNMAAGLRQDGVLREQEIIADAVRSRDAAEHVDRTLTILNGKKGNGLADQAGTAAIEALVLAQEHDAVREPDIHSG